MPNTTLVKDSEIGDDWITKSCQANPIRVTTNARGFVSITTGPVRLGFAALLKPDTSDGPDGRKIKPRYTATLLFPPTTDMRPLRDEWHRQCLKKFEEYFVDGALVGNLEACTKDQTMRMVTIEGTRQRVNKGYTPGCPYLTAKSGADFPPTVVDGARTVITDETRVYPGVWGIAVISPYPYGKDNPKYKKGIGWNLNGVMIIADDSKLITSGEWKNHLFDGVNAQAPSYDPAGMFAAEGAPWTCKVCGHANNAGVSSCAFCGYLNKA